jgi:hypothetical protein
MSAPTDEPEISDTINDKIRLVTLAVAAFLLSIKSDGSFPFAADMPHYQLFLLPFSVVFLLTLFIFVWPQTVRSIYDRLQFSHNISTLKLAVIIAAAFETMMIAVLMIESTIFQPLGYVLNVPLSALIFSSIFVILIALLAMKKIKPLYLFGFTLIAYGMVYLLSVISFPLAPARSDMLPLIVDAARNIIAGNSPYAYYLVNGNNLPMTYLPTLWIPFLPAAFFSFDPRLVNLACVIVAAIIVYRVSENKVNASALMTILLLCPYLQFRHEIYLGVIWLYLAIAFYAIKKDNLALSTLFMAIGACSYQLLWIVVPFYFVYLFKKYKTKIFAIYATAFLAICTIIILPFALWAPDPFISGTVGHWAGQAYVMAANLSALAAFFIGWSSLHILQSISLLAIFLLALRSTEKYADIYKWTAIALTLFIALNTFIDAYFYLIVFLVLIMFALSIGKICHSHEIKG